MKHVLTAFCILVFLAKDVMAAEPLPTLVFNQKIDHFDTRNSKTFEHRYWINSSFAEKNKKDAPVLYRLCGEGDCTIDFQEDWTIEFAKILKAHIVYVEHRYYGKSQPFSDLSNAHLRYLTVENALADFYDLQKNLQKYFKGSWIAVGGSYSGYLSAAYRMKYPEMVKGALASSAPIKAGLTVEAPSLYYTEISQPTSWENYGEFGARQWTYQACTEIGYWLGDQLPSDADCRSVFGDDVKLADKKDVNHKYYYRYLSNHTDAPSNILFTYGEKDVFTKMGLDANENQNSKIEIIVITNGEHHSDLNYKDSSEAITKARERFIELARQWIAE